MPDLLTRLLIAALLIGLAIAAYQLYNRLLLARLQAKALTIEGVRPAQATILYFTTPTCAPCKTVQRPALEKLRLDLGEKLEVVEINAAEKPDLAGKWGVLSVPTTFILDQDCKPRHVNHGVAQSDKLLRQLRDILDAG